MKIAKKINTILCDDVRQEIGEKMSLMGIYSKDIVVNKVPAILPFINLIVMFEDIKEPFDNIFVSLITPESEPIQVSYPPPPGLEKGKDVNIIIGFSPFRLNAIGPAKFEIRFSKNEKPRIVHRFSIKTSD
jgi:Family of unknown function (DUF6941)